MQTIGRTTQRAAGRIASSRLLVQRTGIHFHNVTRDEVAIEVEVENHGEARSEPTELRLEAAPFGAFVRWQPLRTLPVPPIAPGARATVRLVERRASAPPVAGFLASVLTALGRRRASPAARAGLLGELARPQPGAGLPADLFDLLGARQPHWAGNLNVWIGRTPVERHMAPRLRVYPGRGNLAAFCLGDSRDRYAFRIEGPREGEWQYALRDLAGGTSVPWTLEEREEPRWHPALARQYVFFFVRPPERCARGAVLVHVTQRSSGRTAQVEFDLDPAASGPGCFRA